MANMDEAKGRAKEAIGDAADNDELKREGKADRATGKVKDAADSARDKASDAADSIKERLEGD